MAHIPCALQSFNSPPQPSHRGFNRLYLAEARRRAVAAWHKLALEKQTLNGCSWLHSSTKIIFKNPLQISKRTDMISIKSLYTKVKLAVKRVYHGWNYRSGLTVLRMHICRQAISPSSLSHSYLKWTSAVMMTLLGTIFIFQQQRKDMTSCQRQYREGSQAGARKKEGCKWGESMIGEDGNASKATEVCWK